MAKHEEALTEKEMADALQLAKDVNDFITRREPQVSMCVGMAALHSILLALSVETGATVRFEPRSEQPCDKPLKLEVVH